MTKQIEHTSNGTTYLLVEVPESSTNHVVNANGKLINCERRIDAITLEYLRVPLPTGNWSIVGMGNKLELPDINEPGSGVIRAMLSNDLLPKTTLILKNNGN